MSGTLLLLLLSVRLVLAQGTDCPAFVDRALDAVGQSCGTLGRNQVCYGNNSIDSQFHTPAVVHFARPGDRASVLDLEHLTTAPLRPQDRIWGIAVLSLQANLPENLPGQNATFIVFGDTDLQPAEAPAGYDAPMQAFSLSTRIGGLNCQDVPESGLLVQAPENTTVNFMINGVEVNVGSSALLENDADNLTVSTIEGFVQVTSGGATEVAGEGLNVQVPHGRRPQQAVIERSARVRNAPWRLLPRRVEAFPPPPAGQIVELQDCFYPRARGAAQNAVRVRAGEPVVLRLSIPQDSLERARIIQQQARNRLLVNGSLLPVYTRIGPWRGESGEYGDHFGIEFYWLIAAPSAGDLRIVLQTQSLDGKPIFTGIDGPDPDNLPDVIPARQSHFCLVQAGA
ncbi:MAG: hypothetical protein GC204_19505 [Chloroflexi bacterium]|nr:hypothetical protein [Chloroflexota bacterium]